MVIDDIWVITGDSDLIFDLGSSICTKLSAEGAAGEFHAQTTGGYYQIVMYENGAEVDRQFQFQDLPENPRSRVVHDLSEVALWDRSEPMLPVAWETIEQSEGVWLNKSQ